MRSPQRAIQPRQTPDFRQAPLGTRIWKHRSIYLFILPAFVWFLVFCYYPMYGLLLAFKDYKYSKGILGSAWVGLKWFRKFMADPSFWQVVMNTLKYNVSRITVQRALSELKLQGVITRKPRAGTFVLSPAPKPVFSPEKSSDRINIGVVAPFGMESPGIYQYLDGILSALSVPRDNLSLHNTCYVEAYDRTMLENCLKDNCSGIIYYPGLSSAPPLDLLTQMSVEGYPCVLIDKRVPGIELPCVQSNNVLGERAVVEHLIELGHRSIVFAAGSYTMSVYERYEGFCRAMHDAGLGRLDRMYCSLTALEDDRSAMVEQVRAWIHSGVTAVCCSADSHAKRLADLCGEIHVDIPRQLAISGFDGVYRGSITSVLQPYARIGRVATETLLKWILTGDVNREVVEMDAQFLLGASTLPNDEAADAQST